MSGLSIASSSAFSWVLRVYRLIVFPKASEFCLILRDATQAHADVTAHDDIAQGRCTWIVDALDTLPLAHKWRQKSLLQRGGDRISQTHDRTGPGLVPGRGLRAQSS